MINTLSAIIVRIKHSNCNIKTTAVNVFGAGTVMEPQILTTILGKTCAEQKMVQCAFTKSYDFMIFHDNIRLFCLFMAASFQRITKSKEL